MGGDHTLGCGVAAEWSLGKQPNRSGGEQQGQSALDVCGGFYCPLCASRRTRTLPLWTTIIHTADTGVWGGKKVFLLKYLLVNKKLNRPNRVGKDWNCIFCFFIRHGDMTSGFYVISDDNGFVVSHSFFPCIAALRYILGLEARQKNLPACKFHSREKPLTGFRKYIRLITHIDTIIPAGTLLTF